MLPLGLGLIPSIILLYPKVKLLKLKSNGIRNPFHAYLLVTALAIWTIDLNSLDFIDTATGKLTHLNNFNQIEETAETQYYALSNFYIDKRNIGNYVFVMPEGKANISSTVDVYLTAPIFENPNDTLKSHVIAWVGEKYSDIIKDNPKNVINNKSYQWILDLGKQDFTKKDIHKAVYFSRVNGMDKDRFEQSIKTSYIYNQGSNSILLAVNEPYENRYKPSIIWTLFWFLIFGLLMFGMIMVPEFDYSKLKDFENKNKHDSSVNVQ